jgi:hypothetical protein
MMIILDQHGSAGQPDATLEPETARNPGGMLELRLRPAFHVRLALHAAHAV